MYLTEMQPQKPPPNVAKKGWQKVLKGTAQEQGGGIERSRVLLGGYLEQQLVAMQPEDNPHCGISRTEGWLCQGHSTSGCSSIAQSKKLLNTLTAKEHRAYHYT